MGTPVFTGFPPVDLPAAPATNSSTPMKPKHAQSAPSILNGLKSGRTAVMQDTGEVLRQVKLEYFFENLLPKLPERLKLDAVIDRLNDDKVKAITKGGCWSGFSRYPTASTKGEDDTFRPFEKVTVAIGKAATYVMPGRKLKQRVVFKCNPTTVPLSSLRNNSSKPDSYGLATCHHRYDAESRSPHWEVVVVTGEKKKHLTAETVTDNNRKMMWSLNHMMREDVRRRFVFGYTIENCYMRLWYGSRADLLVSESFDFIKDHKTFAHFILSFMYAKDEELGYDTTMVPILTPDGLMQGQHKVQVRGSNGKVTWYRTGKMISNIGAESIRGRGTRVWEVVKLKGGKPDGDPMVLKDTWIDDDREREGTITDRVKNSGKTDRQRSVLQRSLLTVLNHGDVYIQRNHDQTHTLLRRGHAVPDDLEHYPLKAPREDAAGQQVPKTAPIGSGTIRPPVAQPPALLDYGIKAHYRIVFKEVGKSIETLDTVGEIFKMLTEALVAVTVLHQLGWLHRDISSGNLLVYDGHVKVTDFEYAKRTDDDSGPHNLRTGTAHFMAVEADIHQWRFLPVPEATAKSDFDATMSVWEAWEENASAGEATTQPQDAEAIVDNPVKVPAFRYIVLHDLESIWWLAVYLVLDRIVVLAITDKGTKPEEYTAHRGFYDKLFPESSCRYEMFNTTGRFASGEEYVHDSMRRAAKGIEEARKQLVAEYYKAERDIDGITHEVGAAASTAMFQIFIELTKHYTKNQVKVQPLRHSPKVTPEPAGPVVPGQSLDAQTTVLLGKRGRNNKANIATRANSGEAGPSSSKSIATKRARQEAASAVPEDEASLQASDVDEAATTPPRSRSPSVASTMTVPLTIPIPRGKGKGKERARD